MVNPSPFVVLPGKVTLGLYSNIYIDGTCVVEPVLLEAAGGADPASIVLTAVIIAASDIRADE